MNATLSNVTMLVSVCMMIVFLGYAFMHRQERSIRTFSWVMVCRTIYAGSVILEINSDTLTTKLLFRNIEQTSLLLLVPLIVFFTLNLLGKEDSISRLRQSLFFSLFAVWALLVWTNPYHHLIYRHVVLNSSHLEISKTVYAISFNIISYLILGTCVFFLFTFLRRVRPDIRRPGMWLLLCGCIPAVVEIVKLTNPSLTSWFLPLSVYSGFLSMGMLWIIIRYRLFSLVPLARNIVVETMQEGILIVNRSGNIIDSNAYVEPLFANAGAKPLAGRLIGELLAEWPEWLRACRRMEADDMEISASVDGELRVYSVKVYPLAPRGKEKQGTVSVLFDITEKQKRLEQIVKLNQLKDQLFTVVSHDIRDPLAVQMTLLEVLEEDKAAFGSEHREVIDALSGQIQTTFVMIENLLEWFRSQKEGMLLHPKNIRLADAVDEICRMLRIKSEAKQIEIHMEIERGLEAYADREAVMLVIRNLLSNAIKFSNPGGSIVVRAEAIADTVVVSVVDNGVGMEQEKVRGLFDAMKLVSTEGTAGERGTGLGLQVCRQFVQMNGGQIWAKSEPQQGSVFSFSLRAAESEGERDESTGH